MWLLRAPLALIKLCLFVVFSLMIGISQLCVGVIFKDFKTLPMLFHKGVCFILNVKVHVRGEENVSEQQKLFVSNHLSWADIFVIGSKLNGVFIAKADVSGWPFLGQLSYLQRTIFIDRNRAGLAKGLADVAIAINRGDNIFLFPEGTNGYRKGEVLPFKSSYYTMLDGQEQMVVQPIAIKLIKLEGRDIAHQKEFEVYAWGEKRFLAHLWQFLSHWSQEVELIICPAMNVKEGQRKELCLASQQVILNAVK